MNLLSNPGNLAKDSANNADISGEGSSLIFRGFGRKRVTQHAADSSLLVDNNASAQSGELRRRPHPLAKFVAICNSRENKSVSLEASQCPL